jgi:DNA-binding response OmpR family regulator
VKDSAPINDSTGISILSVSPFRDDQAAVEAILHQDSRSSIKWKLYTTATLERATALVRMDRIPIVICERDLRPGSWRELLEETALMPHSPLLIVTSRLADERLWAEVLNVGGWDVLTKPLNRTEVIRVVESAWRQWQNQQDQHQSPARAQRHTATFAAGVTPLPVGLQQQSVCDRDKAAHRNQIVISEWLQ